VIGDGINSIQQLIEITNADPRRGFGHEKVLTQIDVDDMTERLLVKMGCRLIPARPRVRKCISKPQAI
jgi:cyanophycin synthetase